MGRVASRTNPFTAGGTPGPATTIQYDLANNAVISTLPGGNTVRSDYSGATVTATDQVNRKIKREADGLGRLIKVTEQDVATGALTQETSYSYNLLDKLTQVNQGGQYRSYKYDSTGRLLFEKIPEQTPTINDGTGTYWTSAYAYTEFSSVKKKTDARGVESHYAFNALHKVTEVWYTGVGGDDSGNTRPALPSGVSDTPQVGVSYTTSGKLSQVYLHATSTAPGSYQEDYVYDSYDRVQSVKRWILGQTSNIRKTYTTSYEYNGGSQLSKMIYPSGQEVSVNHDDKGRMQSLTYNPGDSLGYLTGVSHNIAGQVTGLTLGNGVAETFGYDPQRMQLTSQNAAKPGNGPLMSLAYSYEAAAGQSGAGTTAGNTGQLMAIITNSSINGTAESAAYSYDNLGRLVTSDQTTNGSSAQRKFGYDRWGNRTTVWPSVFGGSPIQTAALEQSGGAPTNRITSVTNSGVTVNYLYDAAGNVTNDGAHAYQYDADNRLVKVDNGATAQYKYDHQNRRVSKIIGSSWTHYVWQGSQVIGEHDATTPYPGFGQPPYQQQSARLDYIYFGSQRIYSRERASSGGTWTTKYYLSDRLSTRVVLNTSGNVIGRQGHLPFGEDFGESGTQEKHHFTSYERDSESGTDYAVNRQYSQSTGRFNRPDPKQSSARLDGPQSWNRYSYVANEPLDQTDPLGLEPPVGGENNPFENSNCNPAYGDCPAWIHDCQSYGASCSFTSGVGLISGGEGGGSPVRVPPRPGRPAPITTQVSKQYPFPMKCKKNAVGLMDELKVSFASLASYQSKNLFISFERKQIRESARLRITSGIYLGPSRTFHVDVISNWPTGWTFGTESDHVFYPGTIKFSAEDVPDAEQNVLFRVDLFGQLNGLFAEAGFLLGFGDFEDEVWQHLANQIEKKICN